IEPEMRPGLFRDERALGAIARDQALVLEQAERLADRRARHAAFGHQLFDGRDLCAGRPLAGHDAAAEQGRELDVARYRATVQSCFGVGQARHGSPGWQFELTKVRIYDLCREGKALEAACIVDGRKHETGLVSTVAG